MEFVSSGRAGWDQSILTICGDFEETEKGLSAYAGADPVHTVGDCRVVERCTNSGLSIDRLNLRLGVSSGLEDEEAGFIKENDEHMK